MFCRKLKYDCELTTQAPAPTQSKDAPRTRCRNARKPTSQYPSKPAGQHERRKREHPRRHRDETARQTQDDPWSRPTTGHLLGLDHPQPSASRPRGSRGRWDGRPLGAPTTRIPSVPPHSHRKAGRAAGTLSQNGYGSSIPLCFLKENEIGWSIG